MDMYCNAGEQDWRSGIRELPTAYSDIQAASISRLGDLATVSLRAAKFGYAAKFDNINAKFSTLTSGI
jgi:hypothetical protein